MKASRIFVAAFCLLLVISALLLNRIPGGKLWLGFNLILNLDNDPPSQAPGTDYVTTTTLTWSFP